jgi:hypothetical protein
MTNPGSASAQSCLGLLGLLALPTRTSLEIIIFKRGARKGLPPSQGSKSRHDKHRRMASYPYSKNGRLLLSSQHSFSIFFFFPLLFFSHLLTYLLVSTLDTKIRSCKSSAHYRHKAGITMVSYVRKG